MDHTRDKSFEEGKLFLEISIRSQGLLGGFNAFIVTIRLIVPVPGKITILENAAIFLDYQVDILIRDRFSLSESFAYCV